MSDPSVVCGVMWYEYNHHGADPGSLMCQSSLVGYNKGALPN